MLDRYEKTWLELLKKDNWQDFIKKDIKIRGLSFDLNLIKDEHDLEGVNIEEFVSKNPISIMYFRLLYKYRTDLFFDIGEYEDGSKPNLRDFFKREKERFLELKKKK